MSSLPLRRLTVCLFSISVAVITLASIYSLTLARPQASVIVVNPGQSIQAAINSANSGDTVLINPGTYNESLTLNKAVNLTGVNSATVIINALPNQRVLLVSGAAINNSVVISGLTLAKGRVTGGVTWNSCPAGCGGGVMITGTAQPIMQSLIITDNSASAMGGGLYANGPLVLKEVVFFSNTVHFGGGGAYVNGVAIVNDSHFENNSCISTNGGCFGGGLMAKEGLELNNSAFLSNTVVGGTAGGVGGGAHVDFVASASTVATVTDSLFENNRCLNSFCEGGGLSVYGELRAKDTAFLNNLATYAGAGALVAGGSVLERDRFEGNQCVSQTTGCAGGGLMSSGFVTATNTIFISNSTPFSGGVGGGGIYARGGNVVIIDGRFENNLSSAGGGLNVNQVFITRTRFFNNIAQYAGSGVYAQSASIVNSIFANNGDNGAVLTVVDVAGVAGPVEVLHTTFTNSSLASSSAMELDALTANIRDTIVASFTVGIKQFGGAVVSEDYNLFYGNTLNVTGTISGGAHDVFGDPNFANPALGNYHILSPSAAIDAGVNAGVSTDLDGLPRPIGAGFDIGAYEYINFTSWVYLPLVRK
jgi:hypothetical protein